MKHCSILVASLLVTAAPALAQDAGPALRLEEALLAALDGNPSLAAAQEGVPQAMASRDKAWAFIQPTIDLGLSYRINDREIAFDASEMFDSSALTDVFTPIYGNLGFIYGKMFAAGEISADDCDELATINGFDDCAALTSAFVDGEGIGDSGDSGGDVAPTVIQPKSQLFFSAQFQWPISPRVIPLAVAGERGIEAAQAQASQAREQVLASLAQAYGMAYQAQEGVKLLVDQVDLAAAHRRDAEALLRAGVITRDQVLRAQVEEAKIQLQLKQLQRQARQARRAVGMLMGRDADRYGSLAALPTITFDPADSSETLADSAARARPELRGATAQALAARNMAIDSALQFLPTFAVTGQFTDSPVNSGFDDKTYNFNVGLNLGIPVWDGGIRLHSAREASSRKRQAELMVDAQKRQIEVEVADAWDAWQSSLDALPSAELERDLAQEAFRLTEVRYRAGAARQIELLDARSMLQAAELTLLQASVNERLSAIALLSASGRMQSWARNLGG